MAITGQVPSYSMQVVGGKDLVNVLATIPKMLRSSLLFTKVANKLWNHFRLTKGSGL